MHRSRRLAAVPPPLRQAVAGSLIVAVLAGAYGLVESVRDYPVSSWFGVTLFLLMIGVVAGFLLGVVLGTLWLVVTAPARRRS